jgi:hypothetical protein
MSKNITNNSRNERQVSLIHLFEFGLQYLEDDENGEPVYAQPLRFTDHDIFVVYDDIEYTPLSITFDTLHEDAEQNANTVTINIDNVDGSISEKALGYEWRNNEAKITRIAYTPPSEIIDSETYNYGYGDNLGDEDYLGQPYPLINLDDISEKDVWQLFAGVIDTFNASESALQGTLTTEFATWNKPFPYRTFNQQEFTSVTSAITDTIYWGSQKNI